tara:strand:- start:345 stop:1301 length:957 start_codon:yes stop_codon:yes gene_type:complete
MRKYEKPYLSPKEQVELLMSRGMEITDLAKAEECLARIGYYRLSAYWYPFRKEQNGAVEDNFKEGTTFSLSLDYYVFDKKLRLLTLDAIERVEIALRTDIALLLGKFDRQAHRNPEFLHGNFIRRDVLKEDKSSYQRWIEKQNRAFRLSKEEFVTHFKRKYAGQELPIWMDVELWDFGTMSTFYAGMKVADQDYIASLYNLNSGITLANWLRCLNVVRNSCAHHNRLWNRPLAILPRWKDTEKISEIQHLRSETRYGTRYYAAAAIIKTLLNKINPTSRWSDRLMNLMDTLPENPFIGEQNAGFPPNWREQALWKQNP